MLLKAELPPVNQIGGGEWGGGSWVRRNPFPSGVVPDVLENLHHFPTSVFPLCTVIFHVAPEITPTAQRVESVGKEKLVSTNHKNSGRDTRWTSAC